MTINFERTCDQSDMRTKRQRHRAVALTETRKDVEKPEAAHQEITLFVMLSLAFDAVGGIQSPTPDICSQPSQSLPNGDNKTGRVHLEGVKTLLRICHDIRINSERTLCSNIRFPIMSRKIHKRLVTDSSTAMT